MSHAIGTPLPLLASVAGHEPVSQLLLPLHAFVSTAANATAIHVFITRTLTHVALRCGVARG